MVVDFFSGVFAGFCSTMGNNPVDVIKTKMQGEHAHQFNGVMHCGKEILKHDGVMGFYHGIQPRLIRVCLDVGLTFTIFGSIKRGVESFIANRL